MKPFPIIYLPTEAQQEVLFRALHALGWHYMSSDHDVEADWDLWIKTPAAKSPCMCILSMTEMFAYETTNRPWIEGQNSFARFTRMNSVRHFVEYAKRLKADRAAVHAQIPIGQPVAPQHIIRFANGSRLVAYTATGGAGISTTI